MGTRAVREPFGAPCGLRCIAATTKTLCPTRSARRICVYPLCRSLSCVKLYCRVYYGSVPLNLLLCFCVRWISFFQFGSEFASCGFLYQSLPLLCERKYGASGSSRNGEEDDHPGRSFGTTLLLRDTTTTTGSFHSLRGDRAKSRGWCRNFERDRQQNRQALSIGNQRCRDGESNGFQEGKRKAGKPFSSSIAQFLRKKQLGFEKLS